MNPSRRRYRVYLVLTLTFLPLFALSAFPAEEAPLKRIVVSTDAPHNRQLEFVARVPADANVSPAGILVLFGGRNWPGEKSIRTYRFDDLADRLHMLLLSPSFMDDEYWQPEKWSGAALQQAIAKASATFNLSNPPIYYYGYSAGGQCANLFYFWRPENVRAVVIHACGVWSEAIAKLPSAANNTAPFLITCGRDDPERFATSYTTAQRLREGGFPVVFRDYSSGHDLIGLDLAKSFLEDILSGKSRPMQVAQDFADRTIPADDARAKRMDVETLNLFQSDETAKLWLQR